MRLFNNEPHLVEKIYGGDDQAFSSLYEKYRDRFYGYFFAKCSEERFGNRRMYKFNDSDAYLDDLYQNSLIKFYNQIMTAKMFVDGDKIYIRGKDGTINKLTASLETYLISIGKLTLKEMERKEIRYVDFDPIERIAHDDNNPQYGFDDCTTQVNPAKVNVDPIFDLSSDEDLDNEAKFTIVQHIVEVMGPPCKEIFTYFFWEKKSLEEIAQIMPQYSSADSVKNQKSRCHKKFKIAFLEALADN